MLVPIGKSSSPRASCSGQFLTRHCHVWVFLETKCCLIVKRQKAPWEGKLGSSDRPAPSADGATVASTAGASHLRRAQCWAPSWHNSTERLCQPQSLCHPPPHAGSAGTGDGPRILTAASTSIPSRHRDQAILIPAGAGRSSMFLGLQIPDTSSCF